MRSSIITLFALLLGSTMHAQLFTTSGTITVTPGATLHINGDARTIAGGQIDNDGTLFLRGDLTHDAAGTCFGASQGTVVLDGAAQSIGGTGIITFNNLILAGTDDKTLLRPAEVGGAYIGEAGVLQLNDRRLLLNSNTLTVRNASNTAIQRTTGFIVSETDALAGYGILRWNIGTQGTAGTVYEFPFGNDVTGHYLPVRLTYNSPGSGPTGWVGLGAYPTDPNPAPNNRPLPAGLSSLTDMSGMENAHKVLDRWWVMSTGGYSTAPTADIRFTYRDTEWSSGTNLIAEPTLMLQDFWNGQWQYPPSSLDAAGNTLTTTARALRNGPWTASTIGSPLPIELISFTGERRTEREVELRWSTATEHNNAGFAVWRMIEGEDDFTEVAWVDGAGNSQQLISYTHPDDNAATKTSYYKLRQVDHDGQSEWSPVVAVEGAGVSSQLVAYPNPARDVIMLSGPPEHTASITLHDASGRVVKQWTNTTMLNGLGALEGGVYLLRAADLEGHSMSTRVVLE